MFRGGKISLLGIICFAYNFFLNYHHMLMFSANICDNLLVGLVFLTILGVSFCVPQKKLKFN